MVPGLMGYLGGLPTVSITSDIVDLVINDWIGAPDPAVRSDYVLHVAAGVTVSASAVATWAIKSRGRENSSIGYWKIDGYVLGAGGAGGLAFESATPSLSGAAGGGGAGLAVGAGGLAHFAGREGLPGTDTSGSSPWPGGAAGSSGGVPAWTVPPGDAVDGGRAGWISHALIIDMSSGTGRIWGGGGGGKAQCLGRLGAAGRGQHNGHRGQKTSQQGARSHSAVTPGAPAAAVCLHSSVHASKIGASQPLFCRFPGLWHKLDVLTRCLI